MAVHPDELRAAMEKSFESYRSSLADDVRWLLDRYRFVDLAIKVVGVGSVGTRCSVALFLGSNRDDVLLLQIKEATATVLEEHLPSSPYSLHGQLKDWKGSVDLDRASPKRFFGYARLCGLTLARAHAVSGDPAAIAGYLGKGTVFDRAIGEFAVRYSEQNLADYQAFAGAIESGRLEAHLAV